MSTNVTKGDLALDDEGAKAFGKLITEWEDGELHSDLSKELLVLNGKLREHAKLRGKAKGELTLTVKLDCDEYGVMGVATSYKVKAPTPPRRKTTMWLTPGGNLSTANPKQVLLPLRDVSVPAKAVDVPETTPKTRSI